MLAAMDAIRPQSVEIPAHAITSDEASRHWRLSMTSTLRDLRKAVGAGTWLKAKRGNYTYYWPAGAK